MKAAFHFLTIHPSIPVISGPDASALLFREVLAHPVLTLYTKAFVGDLLFHVLVESDPGPKLRATALDRWLKARTGTWVRMARNDSGWFERAEVYAVCLESIDADAAETLHQRLLTVCPAYVGSMEVDDTSPYHWRLYSYGLVPAYRVLNRAMHVFWEGPDEDSKLQYRFDLAVRCGFQPVEWESLNFRYSVFDAYHDFGHAKRVAIWKRRAGNLLAFIADEAVTKLSDAAPGIGDKLYAAIQQFEDAETVENLANALLGCRRTYDYVVDCLFPAIPGGGTGRHKLDAEHVRNRLLAFAEKEQQSATNVSVVATSIDSWAKQIESFERLVNKGIHQKVCRAEARRCLLKTILLLDDIASLRPGHFEMQGHFQ